MRYVLSYSRGTCTILCRCGFVKKVTGRDPAHLNAKVTKRLKRHKERVH